MLFRWTCCLMCYKYKGLLLKPTCTAQEPSPSTTELENLYAKDKGHTVRGHRSREDHPADITLEGTPANKRRRGTRAAENGTAPIGHAGELVSGPEMFVPVIQASYTLHLHLKAAVEGLQALTNQE